MSCHFWANGEKNNSIVGQHHDEQAKLSKIERNERRTSQMNETDKSFLKVNQKTL
jgi:hypothetical protein